MRFSLRITRYIIGAVLPYFVFSWLLLSVILFVQQASRFSEIFFNVNIPTGLIWQLSLALVPGVIAFTCPMAVLVGVVIGLLKMQSDSEVTAVRAAGVSNTQIAVPMLALGCLTAALAFAVNLYGVPLAAAMVRRVALRAAIAKLESPVEPGVFNTEIAGYTVYVKGGDADAGTWQDIFIFNEDERTGTSRLIASKRGRIDTTGQVSELVLENASVSTFSNRPDAPYVSESIGEFRFAIKTRRGELIDRLSLTVAGPDELGLSQLAEFAAQKEGSEQTEALILWQRRLLLSLTPIIFSLLGTAIVLSSAGRGRGFGIAMALMCLLIYFLAAFLGEQLARTGRLSVSVSGLLPIAASAFIVLLFSYGRNVRLGQELARRTCELLGRAVRKIGATRRRNFFIGVTTGLRDFDLVLDLLRYYLLSLAFLGTIFLIFTAFELWKFAGAMPGGPTLLARYLGVLLPFVYLQLAPSAAMVATLATYVIKARQNELITWIAAGQSTYRLLLPCLVFIATVGGMNLILQETIAPSANEKQDSLRNLLRSRGAASGRNARFWSATENRIYSFEAVINDVAFCCVPPGDSAPWAGALSNAPTSKKIVHQLAASDNEEVAFAGFKMPISRPIIVNAGARYISKSLSGYCDFPPKGREFVSNFGGLEASYADAGSNDGHNNCKKALRVGVGPGFDLDKANPEPTEAVHSLPDGLAANPTRTAGSCGHSVNDGMDALGIHSEMNTPTIEGNSVKKREPWLVSARENASDNETGTLERILETEKGIAVSQGAYTDVVNVCITDRKRSRVNVDYNDSADAISAIRRDSLVCLKRQLNPLLRSATRKNSFVPEGNTTDALQCHMEEGHVQRDCRQSAKRIWAKISTKYYISNEYNIKHASDNELRDVHNIPRNLSGPADPAYCGPSRNFSNERADGKSRSEVYLTASYSNEKRDPCASRLRLNSVCDSTKENDQRRKYYSEKGRTSQGRIYNTASYEATATKISGDPKAFQVHADSTGEARPVCEACAAKNVVIYEFRADGRLGAVYRSDRAIWRNGKVALSDGANVTTLTGERASQANAANLDLSETINPFAATKLKPSQMTVAELATRSRASRSEAERRTFEVALQKKLATPFLPLVIAIFTAPFALSLGRRGKAATVGAAVGLWMLFVGISSGFEQLGASGFLAAPISIWSPVVLFAALGLWLLSKSRT